MSKRNIFTAILLTLILFVSCNPEIEPEKQYGSLTVSAGSNSSQAKTLEPAQDESQLASYTIKIKSTTAEAVTTYSTNGTSYTIDNLEAGEYKVWVEGVNEKGTAILYSATQTITISNKQTTTAIFKVDNISEGTGTLKFSLAVPKNEDSVNKVVFKIHSAAESTKEYFTTSTRYYTQEEGSENVEYRCFDLNISLATGNYYLEACMFNEQDGTSTQVGFSYFDSVFIYKDSTTSSSLIWNGDFFPAVVDPVVEEIESDQKYIKITCSNPIATIYYTTDGSTPTTASTKYLNPIPLTESIKLRTIAVVEGLRPSKVVSKDYILKVENPVFSIKNNSIVNYDKLEITSATAGATIIYTLDGSMPSKTNGKVYTSPFVLTKNLVVKAIAIKDNFEDSNVVSAQYYDVNTPSADEYFTITQQGAISANRNYEGTLPSILIIPSVLNGIEVTEIAKNAFKNITDITLVSIPDTVTVIGDGAFYGCTNIESIDLSVYLTSIGSSAFSGWTEAQRINDYSGLIKAGVLVNCNAKLYVTIKAGTQIVSGYTGMENLYGVYMSNNITTIVENAFSGCVNLEDFSLPEYVTYIGSLAFNECTKIKSITLPAILKLEKFATDAFRGWTNEQSIIDTGGLALNGTLSESNARIYTKIPSTYTTITTSMFQDRADIYGVEIPSSITTIEDNAFEGTNIEKLVIPKTVESLGVEVFKGWAKEQKVEIVYGGYVASTSSSNQTPFTNCDAMFTVSIDPSVTEIKANAFSGMTNLFTIDIPSSVTKIGDLAFTATSLATVTLGENVKSIGDYCFAYCTELKEVNLASGLTSVGAYAFSGCNSLQSITLPDTVTSIGDEAFASCANLQTVNLGTGITTIPKQAFDGSPKLSTIIAPNCKGSMNVTVKVPLEQLIVHDVAIKITPAYASISGYETKISRAEQTLDGDWRVFTYTIDDMLGLYYNVDVVLYDYQNVQVGEKNFTDCSVVAGNNCPVNCQFALSDLTERNLSATTITPTGSTYLDGTEIVITNTDDDVSIRYTLDGSTPTESNGTIYSEPIVLHELKNVKAVAYKEGYAFATVSTNYSAIKVQSPVMNLDSSPTYPSTQYLTLSTATEGATIYYKIDSSSYSKYKSPIEISKTSTVYAYATKVGFTNSSTINVNIDIEASMLSEFFIVGEKGPAGGYVFYDCDADNTEEDPDGADNLKSSECGWRYLEAAPEDLSYTDSSGTKVTTYPFGYYRTSSSGSNLTVGTEIAIGTGKANTEALVKAMGETAYTMDSGTDKGIYAAKACVDYSITVDGVVYDDWFLPSKDELDLMYDNLEAKGLGSFADDSFYSYWSSSESSSGRLAWLQTFSTGNQYSYAGGNCHDYVRPIRAFTERVHVWDSGVVTMPETCATSGIKTFTCTDCKQTKIECISATGEHTYVNYRCSVCGQYGVGLSGGYIFYDCDEDNDSGNADGLISTECGWRYLEAAPEDLSSNYPFGYYRTSSSGSNLTVGTETAIGTGKANTEALVKAMGETAYTKDSGTDKGIYAAKACVDYSITVDGIVYDDWFLPSKDELDLMYDNLEAKGLGSFACDSYWSSSEGSGLNAWGQYFYHGTQGNVSRYYDFSVRPVRAF